ncbi:MAG: hypothetical protein WD512_20135 [Candidatus Paceibacterota bacterium]
MSDYDFFYGIIAGVIIYGGVNYLSNRNKDMIISSDDLVLTSDTNNDIDTDNDTDSVLSYLKNEGYDISIMSDQEICDIYKKSFTHLTSHLSTDFPCICFFVYSDLRKAGFNTSIMSHAEICESYNELSKRNPTLYYRKLYVT